MCLNNQLFSSGIEPDLFSSKKMLLNIFSGKATLFDVLITYQLFNRDCFFMPIHFLWSIDEFGSSMLH